MYENPSSPDRSPERRFDVVLGAGGIKGFGHIGFLKALEDKGVPVGRITGVSVGSIVAAFYTNGFSTDELVRVFLHGVSRRFDPATLARCLSFPDPLSFAIGGCLDLTGPFADLVKEHRLTPNDRLQIVSFDILRQDPVPFRGSGYDLAHALAASCSLPTVFRPVWDFSGCSPRLLVDGALYHYNPTELSGEQPVIVSMFQPATQWPRELQAPIDLYFHLREMYLPIAPHRRHVDGDKHVVVEIGHPDVAGLNFGLSPEKCLQLVEDGYVKTCAAIDQARLEGRLPE